MDLSSIRDLTTAQTGTGAMPNVTKPSNMSTGDLILVWIAGQTSLGVPQDQTMYVYDMVVWEP